MLQLTIHCARDHLLGPFQSLKHIATAEHLSPLQLIVRPDEALSLRIMSKPRVAQNYEL